MVEHKIFLFFSLEPSHPLLEREILSPCSTLSFFLKKHRMVAVNSNETVIKKCANSIFWVLVTATSSLLLSYGNPIIRNFLTPFFCLSYDRLFFFILIIGYIGSSIRYERLPLPSPAWSKSQTPPILCHCCCDHFKKYRTRIMNIIAYFYIIKHYIYKKLVINSIFLEGFTLVSQLIGQLKGGCV